MAFTIGKTDSRRNRSIALASFLPGVALSLTGCTLGTIQTSSVAPVAAQVSGLTGRIMGGEQPIAGSTVTVYTVGTTGYGTGAAAISGATTTTDTFGNFMIPAYTCPVSNSVGATGTDPLTYIVATGGNPGLGLVASVTGETVTGSAGAYTDTFTAPNNFYVGEKVVFSGFSTFSYLNGTQTISAVTTSATSTAPGSNTGFSIADTSASNPGAASYMDSGLASGVSSTNSSIKLVAPTGPCSTAKNVTLDLDEVTTAATAYALAQFINPTTGQIGAPNTLLAQTGITNAVSTVANLVNNSGQAVTSFTQSNSATNNGIGGTFSATITGTPEATKLGTVADIISSCVNSAGNTGSSSNCGVLFANTNASTAPTDTFGAAVDIALNPTSTPAQITALYGLVTAQAPFPALAAQPDDWTIGILYTDTTTNQPVLTLPVNIAIDASGDVYVLSDGSSVKGAFGELSPTGVPLVGTNTGLSLAASPNANVAFTTINPRNLVVDLYGNVFFGTTTTAYLWEYNSSNNALDGMTVGLSPWGLAVDSNNNLFVGRASTSATNTYPLAEFLANGSSVNITSSTSVVNYVQQTQTTTGTGTGTANVLFGQYLAFDPSNDLWFAGGSNGTVSNVYKMSNITPCTPVASPTTPTSPAPASNSFVPAPATSCYTTTAAPGGTFVGPTSGGTKPYGIAAESTGVWVANNTGNNLSLFPTAATTSSTPTATVGVSGVEVSPKYIAVDGAGNVWSPNNSGNPGGVNEYSATGVQLSPTTNSNTVTPAATTGFKRAGFSTPAGVGIDPSGNVWVANNNASTNLGSVFEIVGAAAPTITPIAAGLGSKIATKP